ncbi:TIGR03773 family transporter-associated surface protein [Corynebacterium jeikeium]|uniref:TIGR03773 family transporter-associated surface protein n=1 Tax=Corynebacterium jeikeium TaxID=38289 RepID=UPI000557C92C|nr:TIGR03773 family transporter-associated surface protein [Corynebacterium jeikeium]
MRTSPLAALSVALLAGFAAFLGIGSLGPQSLPEAKADSVTLNQGHIDAFHVTSSGKGNLKLDLTEDVTGSHVAHDPNNVTLEVGAHAYEPRTKDVAEVGVPTYFLPQTQEQDLIWPGWDTQGVAPHYQGVKINFNRVCGPGRVFMWSQAFGGGATPLLSDGVEVKSGNSINQANPSHVHANWGFERPGRYSMQVQATADGAESEVKTYTWVVGKSDQDSNADEPAEGATPCGGEDTDTGAGASDNSNSGGNASGGATGGGSAGAGTGNKAGSAGKAGATGKSSPAGKSSSSSSTASSTGSAGTQGSATCKKGEPALRPQIKDDRQQPAKWTSPSALNFGLGSAAKTNLPQSLGPVGAGTAWMIGATQSNGVPWVGVNTMHPDLLANTQGDVTFKLTSFSGPGSMYVFEQGNLGQVVGKEWFKASGGNASGAHVVPRNSHVHPNWVFSKPGTYKVGITQTATTKQGKKISAPATLTFTVGGSGNANSGHFDFGATVTTDGDCASGAEGGSGAAGAGGGAAGGDAGTASGADGSLADTGSTSAMLALAIAGAGLIALGAGVVYMLRTNSLSADSVAALRSMTPPRSPGAKS